MERKTVLPAERDTGFRGVQGRFSVVAEDFEPSVAEIHVDERRGMSGFDRARDRLVHQFPRACDIASAPSRRSQIRGRNDVGVWTEAELGFAVSLGVVDAQRLFKTRPRLWEIALEEASRSQKAMRGRRLRRSRRVFRCKQEALGRFQG